MTGRFIRVGCAVSCSSGGAARSASDMPRHVVERVLTNALPKAAKNRSNSALDKGVARMSTNSASGSALVALRQVSQVLIP